MSDRDRLPDDDTDITDRDINFARVLSKVEERTANILISLRDIKDDIQSFKEEVVDKYVTKESFSPVQKIVYGIVGVILSAVLMAALKLTGF